MSSIHSIKGWVQCFLVHVVMNKCFFLTLKNNLEQIRLIVFEKNANRLTPTHSNSEKSDAIEPKTRRLGYSNNQLNCQQVKVSISLSETILINCFRKPESDF